MYREWKKIEFPVKYYVWISKQHGWEAERRNRWQDEVREYGRLVGGKGWKERVHDREEWKKLLRTARNRQILHVLMGWMNEWMNECVRWSLHFKLLFQIRYTLSRSLVIMDVTPCGLIGMYRRFRVTCSSTVYPDSNTFLHNTVDYMAVYTQERAFIKKYVINFQHEVSQNFPKLKQNSLPPFTHFCQLCLRI
jgi:hypothetical protein